VGWCRRTKGLMEYWDSGDFFHSEKCPTTGITGSYDSYMFVSVSRGVGSSRAIPYHVGLHRARRATQYYLVAYRQRKSFHSGQRLSCCLLLLLSADAAATVRPYDTLSIWPTWS